MHILVKSSTAAFPSEQAMFSRSLTGLILLSLAWPFVRPRLNNPKRSLLPLLARGILGSVALLLFFKSISLIPLANATMLCYTYPVFLSAFAVWFLKEKSGPLTWILLGIAVLGMVFILKPSFSGIGAGEWSGAAAGIFTGLALFFVVFLKREGESTFLIVWFFFLCGTILSAFFAFRFKPIPDPGAFLRLAGIGICALAAQLSMTAGYRSVPASLGGALSLTVIVFTALAAVFFFGETPDPASIAGGSMILAAGAILSLKKTA
jgi:drug/metabolite transporter (DMT)-like permease